MLALFLFVTTVQADCTFPHQYILYCNEIEVFPIIEQRTDIVFIDIENTQLKHYQYLHMNNGLNWNSSHSKITLIFRVLKYKSRYKIIFSTLTMTVLNQTL